MTEMKNVFLKTPNVRRFEDLMAGLGRNAGEGRLACVWGEAGRGKTATAIHHHATHPSVLIRALQVWTERGFVRTVCDELQADYIPHTKTDCFNSAIECLRAELTRDPRFTVFIDEIERLPKSFLEVVRDLTDLSGVPIVLIGEAELRVAMSRLKRVWSRTVEVLEFAPIDAATVMAAWREWTEGKMSAAVAGIIHGASRGDLRVVKRDFGTLLRLMDSAHLDTPSEELARKAINAGMKGVAS